MENLEKHKSEIFCPQCGGKNFFDSPNVKFCRFCGLSLLESRDAVRGLTKIKQQGLRYAYSGYWMLQMLFIVMIMLFIREFPWWASTAFMLIFALSNGFFIAGQIAVGKPDQYVQKQDAKKIGGKLHALQNAQTISAILSVTENTTRNLRGAAYHGKNGTAKLI